MTEALFATDTAVVTTSKYVSTQEPSAAPKAARKTKLKDSAAGQFSKRAVYRPSVSRSYAPRAIVKAKIKSYQAADSRPIVEAATGGVLKTIDAEKAALIARLTKLEQELAAVRTHAEPLKSSKAVFEATRRDDMLFGGVMLMLCAAGLLSTVLTVYAGNLDWVWLAAFAFGGLWLAAKLSRRRRRSLECR